MSIELVMPSSHLILCRPLLLPPIPPSTRVLSNESTFHMSWPKYWSFSFSISPSNEHPGLISLRMDWLDLLAVRGTHKSLLQYHSSKPSILQHSPFFTVQLSHPYMTTGKTIALTWWTFFGNVISLLFNMLSRLVIAFLPRSKRLLISWLQSPSAVILEPNTVSTVLPSISHEVMGLDAMILVFWIYQDLAPHKNLQVAVLEIRMSNNQNHRNTPLPFRIQAAYSQTEFIAASKHMTWHSAAHQRDKTQVYQPEGRHQFFPTGSLHKPLNQPNPPGGRHRKQEKLWSWNVWKGDHKHRKLDKMR